MGEARVATAPVPRYTDSDVNYWMESKFGAAGNPYSGMPMQLVKNVFDRQVRR